MLAVQFPIKTIGIWRNMTTKTRKMWLASVAILAALGLTQPTQSQSWPQRPVRIMVPFPAGGNTDAIARLMAQRFAETFGQQFIVENRPGAAGAIAAEAVARAPADGHTLFVGSPSQIAITPAMNKTSYDPVKDFAPIGVVGTNPLVLVVHPGMPAKTLSEFVDYVRGQTNKLSYASVGLGSITHLTMALFMHRAGLEMIPVMYKGGAPALTDVIGGHVPMYFANLSETLPHATSGALRLLAVTSEKRVPQIPDVPTIAESGFPGFRVLTWNGLMAPAGTPKEIIDRIAKEAADAVKEPKIAERLASIGVDPLGNAPDEFAAMIAADIAMWAEAVKIAGVQEK